MLNWLGLTEDSKTSGNDIMVEYRFISLNDISVF